MKKRFLSVFVMLMMLFGTFAESVFADSGNVSADPIENYSTEEYDSEGVPADAEYAPNRVVVMYEDGSVDTDEPASSSEKNAFKKAENEHRSGNFGLASGCVGDDMVRETENTLGEQVMILDRSLKGDYCIEDTVVFESDRKSSDMVISTISSDTMSTEQMIESLSLNDDIKYAEPDYVIRASEMPDWSDTYLDDMHHLYGEYSINADSVWETEQYDEANGNSKTEPVIVAVVDSGVDYTHPDLKNRMWEKPAGKAFSQFVGKYGYDFVNYTNDPMDQNGHGSHCAGIIAGEANNAEGMTGVAGISDKVEILAVRCLNENGAGYSSALLAGMRYVTELKKAGANICAMNCSFGGNGYSSIYPEVIDEAGKAGILTCIAAGNESSDNDLVFIEPANADSDYGITVAASDTEGEFASYSNYGMKNVDIVAPGTNILSTVCNYSYTPYLYDAGTIRGYTDEQGRDHEGNTAYYGEFDGAVIEKVINAQGEVVDAVRPVTGTDYFGNVINSAQDPAHQTGEFGMSVMLANRVQGSKGKATLELSDETVFPVGNNSTNLRWRITNASKGDVYILYFPYEKEAGDNTSVYISIVNRRYSASTGGARGNVDYGDIKINGIDQYGQADWTDAYRDGIGENHSGLSYMSNSSWRASPIMNALYPYSQVREVNDACADQLETVDTYEHQEKAGTDENDEAKMILAAENDGADASGQIAADENSTDAAAQIIADAVENTIEAEEEQVIESSEEDRIVETQTGDQEISDVSTVRNLSEGYGIGFVFQVTRGGNCYIDISSLAISKSNADETSFGKYDVMSGTSMATPVVTGAAALLSAMNPDLSVTELKTALFSATDDRFSDWCSTGGMLDLSRYEAPLDDRKPAITNVIADFENGTVTLYGSGFGTAPSVKIKRNRTDSEPETIPVNDIRLSDGNIIISHAGARISDDDGENHGIIGSDITFFVENTQNGRIGRASFFVIKGLASYTDAGEVPAGSIVWKGGSDDVNTYFSELDFIPGANDLLMYDPAGNIYWLGQNQDNLAVYKVGAQVESVVDAYIRSRKDSAWHDVDPYRIHKMSAPVCMGNIIYELIRVELPYRTATLLLGLDPGDSDQAPEWMVLYDSLNGLGSAPEDLVWNNIKSTTLAGYRGRLYLVGSILTYEHYEGEQETADGYTEKDIMNTVFSCDPLDILNEGAEWRTEEALLVCPRANGIPITQGGNLYYVLSTSSSTDVDLNVYRFNGSEWSLAGTLPKAFFTIKTGDKKANYNTYQYSFDSFRRIPCAVSIDDRGILFGGMPFDEAGDTLRFNTSTGKTEPLAFSLWGGTVGCETYGTGAGGSLWVGYYDGGQDVIVYKTIDVTNDYVRLQSNKSGDGSGRIYGTGSYSRGDASKALIVSGEGSYIYSAFSKGTGNDIDLEEIKSDYAETVQKRRQPVILNYDAQNNAEVDVVFGRISTRVIAKSQLTKKTGTYDLGIRTDGTINGVDLVSSNTKYAVVNKDGTVTFKEAGAGKTVTITATAKDNKAVQAKCRVTIQKLVNPITVTTEAKTVKYAKVKEAKQTVKAITVKNAKGTVTYEKTSGSGMLSVDPSTGKITVRKGTKKGTYSAVVRVTAAGNSRYREKSVKVKVKIIVK